MCLEHQFAMDTLSVPMVSRRPLDFGVGVFSGLGIVPLEQYFSWIHFPAGSVIGSTLTIAVVFPAA